MSVNESFKAELKERLKTFKKSNNLYGVEYVFIDPNFGKTTHTLKTRGRYSWEDFEKEIFQTIETCEILSYSFLNPEP